MQLQMKLTGARELNEMLRRLPGAVAQRVGGRALRAGAKPILDQARQNAPVGPDTFTKYKDYNEPDQEKSGRSSGRLRRAIKIRTDAYKGNMVRKVVVVVSNKRAGINPHWIEYGTAATRTAKRGGFMVFVIDGKLIRKRSVRGIKANPFMRPAADTRWQEAVQIIHREVGNGVVTEAVRLGNGTRS